MLSFLSYATSKDAYMLVYTRRTTTRTEAKPPVPIPPSRALDAVQTLVAEHDKACAEFKEKYVFPYMYVPSIS